MKTDLTANCIKGEIDGVPVKHIPQVGHQVHFTSGPDVYVYAITEIADKGKLICYGKPGRLTFEQTQPKNYSKWSGYVGMLVTNKHNRLYGQYVTAAYNKDRKRWEYNHQHVLEITE